MKSLNHPLEELKLKSLIMPDTGKDIEKLERSYSACGSYNNFRNQFLRFLKKLNIHLPCDPAFLLIGICKREIKAYANTRLVHKCS